MDENTIESGEPIFELASECETLFSIQISKLKEETDPNGSKIVGEYQQRFSAWAAFLGVFAVPDMCLDRRLQRHADIQDLVLRLLDIMKRNLTYLFEAENTSAEGSTNATESDRSSSPRPQLQISIESIRGIEGAIERLHHLGSTIQLSSEASQATKLVKFAARLDSTSFEAVARLAISSFYPDISPSLLEHLTHAMTDMYQEFHYRRSRQERLQVRPPVQLPTIDEAPSSQIEANTRKDDSPSALPPVNDIYKRLVRPIVRSHLGARSRQSEESKPTSLDSREFKKLFPQQRDGSVKSKTRSIAASLIAYPLPSGKSLSCDWCFLPLSEDKLKGDKWKKHLNEDFKPFVCISEKCSKPPSKFATSRAWFEHMLETHGQNWHREVHLPAWWICPICNNQDTTYAKIQDLSEHISKLHRDVFTEQQTQIIVHQSRIRAPRPQDVCPLCCLSMRDDPDADEEDRGFKRGIPKPTVQREQLVESYKRIKTNTGSLSLNEHSEATPISQISALQSPRPVNVEKIARHVAAHLQGIMLFALRMMALEVASDRFTDDKALSGDTDDDLSRLGSDRQHSLPETQMTEDDSSLSDQDDNMNVDDPLSENTIPDCERDIKWSDFIPNSEPPPEADTFLQQVIDSGAFQTKEQAQILGNAGNKTSYKPDSTVRPHTPPATIIMFPFRHDPHFTGHEAILHDLVNECSAPPARWALVGLGGIGKTHLAVELAYRLVKLAKMSVFWVNAESRSSLDQGFKNIISNVAPWRRHLDLGEIASKAAYKWLTDERNGRWIMILDGANDHSIFHDDAYLPDSRNGTIIITTRRRDVAQRLTESSQDVIEVGPLSVVEAVSLLKKKLGAANVRFTNDSAASGLVKSLGLIPLAICRAAAYVQSLSAEQPIMTESQPQPQPQRRVAMDPPHITEFASEHYFEKLKQLQASHQQADHAESSVTTTTASRFILPLRESLKPADVDALKSADSKRGNRRFFSIRSKISSSTTHDDPPSVIANSEKQDDPDDTFMYEGDEDENMIDHSRDHKTNHSDGSSFNDSDSEGGLSEEDDSALPSVDKYLVQLTDSEEEREKLLVFEVYTSEGLIPHTLFRTWKSSFDDIPTHSSTALDLLSLMSFFDRRGIPKWLLTPSRAAVQTENPSGANEADDDEANAALDKDIQLLTAFCLIRANRTEQLFSMPGLIQIAVKKRLAKLEFQLVEQHFILRLVAAFPTRIYSNWTICEELFAHVQVAANLLPKESVLRNWAILLHKGARYARLQGRYDIALQMTNRALKAIDVIKGDDMKTKTLEGLILMDLGQYDIAEEVFTKIVDRCKSIDTRVSNNRLAMSLRNLASIYKAQGRWKEAEDIQGYLDSAEEWRFSQTHPRRLASKARMASIYRSQGEYTRARTNLEEVYEGYGKTLGPDHRLTLTTMNNLGSIYRLLGNFSFAEGLQKQAMESLRAKLGADHPETLASMNCLASTYRAQGRLDEAQALQEQTLELRTMKLGSDHPNTMASMNNLALIYSVRGKHDKAARLQSKVLEMCEVKLGPEHPHTLTSRNNIALIKKAQGQGNEAVAPKVVTSKVVASKFKEVVQTWKCCQCGNSERHPVCTEFHCQHPRCDGCQYFEELVIPKLRR